jgi:hypothetical protein
VEERVVYAATSNQSSSCSSWDMGAERAHYIQDLGDSDIPLSEYALGGAPKVLDLGSGPWRWEPDRKGSEAEKLEPPKPEEKL